MTSFKTYLSFVFLFAFVLSSHVLTHELPNEYINEEETNDEEVNPLEVLTSDSSISYNPKGDWGMTIGSQPKDEFDDEDIDANGVYNRGRGLARPLIDDKYYDLPLPLPIPPHVDDKYYDLPLPLPRVPHVDDKYYRRNPRIMKDQFYIHHPYVNNDKYYNHRNFKEYSSKLVHPQYSNLQNTKLKTYNLDGSIKKHRKIMIIPSKFDFWTSISHENGDKKGHGGVDKSTMT
ncbi:hypothetical protein PIB30_039638 [Stylosanthes scabra]|uniref:Uncharacterized protein n=1 Tax=Stylosanthes scabra TaxID=79078 RepID=A0ABU6SEA0_9FABA|nr:hypothetical protein [Stylosanthes scabra]